MIHTWQITIPELSGSENRKVYVYLPESYDYDREKRYPVLYMFDGHNVFFDSDATYGKSWGMGEYMDSTQTQLIIAAVECTHNPDNGRLREYAPYPFATPQLGKVSALGPLTMRWLIHTFKPDIDRRYRTLSDREHTFIAGSSMGGLMSLYAVLEFNYAFSRAAALSPSIWFSIDRLERMILRSKAKPDTVVYMDYGEKELQQRPNMHRQFARTAAQLTEKKLLLTSRIVPGGTHCEASWERQIPFFMDALLYERDNLSP